MLDIFKEDIKQTENAVNCGIHFTRLKTKKGENCEEISYMAKSSKEHVCQNCNFLRLNNLPY